METKRLLEIDEIGGARVITTEKKSASYLGPQDDSRFLRDLLKVLGLNLKFEVKERG